MDDSFQNDRCNMYTEINDARETADGCENRS